MSVTILPVTPALAAELSDIDLSRPIAPEDLAAVGSAFATYAVLVFTNQGRHSVTACSSAARTGLSM